MELIVDIFQSIKKDIIKTITNANTTTFHFQTSLKFPKQSQVLPTKNITKKMMIDTFYKVSNVSNLEIYVDNIDISFEEEKLFKNEINNYYLNYSQELGGIPIIIPFIIVNDLFCLFYNNILIHPYVQLRYINNPIYYFFKIDITFRKSLVNN